MKVYKPTTKTYNDTARWLAAEPKAPPVELLAPLTNAPLPADVQALAQTGGSEEYATPVSRAQGQVIRLLPFSLVWGLLTWGLVWVLGLSWPYLLLGFAVLTAATYWRMNRDEFEYSRNGLERHRVDTAADLAEKQMDQQHELRRLALDAYLKMACNQYWGGNDNE